MELHIDLNKFKQIIKAIPEKPSEPFIKTEGFNYLYQTIYLPLVGYDQDSHESKYLNVNISKFSFDDLLIFYKFLSNHYEGAATSPLSTLDGILSKLPPISRKQIFI